MTSRVRITREFVQSAPVDPDPTALFTVLRRPTKLALDRAIEKAGSEAELAKRLGISQQAVNNWKRFDRDIPMTRWEKLIALAERGEPAALAERGQLAALQTLIPHVLHYATLPHAHSGAYRDAADALALVAKATGEQA